MPKKKPQADSSQQLIPIEMIADKIFLIRDRKVMLDADLANLYGVPTRALDQAVNRNIDRFPEGFMFQLAWGESKDLLRSRFVTLNSGNTASTE